MARKKTAGVEEPPPEEPKQDAGQTPTPVQQSDKLGFEPAEYATPPTSGAQHSRRRRRVAVFARTRAGPIVDTNSQSSVRPPAFWRTRLHAGAYRPPAGKGKAVKPSRRKSPRRTKTDVAGPERRHTAVTVGRTHVRRRIDERAATQHTAILVINC